jgi:[ribosomal protein S18]-alanine N-acetyltransferase
LESSKDHGSSQIVPKLDTQIRAACPADIPSIVGLERQASSAAHWPESFYRAIFEGGGAVRIFRVAEAGGLLQGFLLARVIADECELENIIVAEASQRRGFGSKLIRALVEAARDQNATRILLEVRESNASARALYEKCGFALTGRRKAYYTNPVEDAVGYTLKV